MKSDTNLPSVIFVGPLKTATSYIYNYFLNHASVGTSEPIKEIFYYDKHYNQGKDWYLSHFLPQPKHNILIDISPSYLIEADAIKRIKTDNPNVKIIMTLRDPVERYLSHVRHHISHGYSYTGFENLQREHPKISQGSQYENFVDAWINEFGEENVSLFDYKDLTKDPVNFMKKICETIGVPFNADFDFEHRVNTATTARSPRITRFSHIIIHFLIKNGLANIIYAVKKTGLKKLLLKKGSHFEISKEDLSKANEYFKNSTLWYDNRFAHPIIRPFVPS